MQPDFEKTAAAMIAGTQKAIAAALAPLERRLAELEARPTPERGEKGDPGERGAEGLPGVSVKDAFRQEGGVLILTLSDGTTRDLGPIVGPAGEKGEKGDAGEAGPQGEKGAPGERGEPGLPGEKGERGDVGPVGEKGLQGERGEKGADGFSLKDFDVNAIDARTVCLSFADETQRFEAELKFPVMIDCGVFKAGESYEPGDTVTWGGSLWTAQRATDAKPDSPDSGWRLSVKKGRDGKDAKA